MVCAFSYEFFMYVLRLLEIFRDSFQTKLETSIDFILFLEAVSIGIKETSLIIISGCIFLIITDSFFIRIGI